MAAVTSTTSSTSTSTSTSTARQEAAERAAAQARAEAAKKAAEAAASQQQAAETAQRNAQLQSKAASLSKAIGAQRAGEARPAGTSTASSLNALAGPTNAGNATSTSPDASETSAKARRTGSLHSSVNSITGPTSSGGQASEETDGQQSSGRQALDSYRKALKPAEPSSGEWTHEDAEDYTDAVASELEQHEGDAEYAEALLALSADGLKKSAEVLGGATTEGEEGPNAEAISNLAYNFGRIGDQLEDEQAAQLAYGVASEFESDSTSLGAVDGGFSRFAGEDGGRFSELVAGALHEQGNGEAAQGMLEGDPGFFDSLVNKAEDAGETVGGLLKGAAEKGFDALVSGLDGLGDDIRGVISDGLDLRERIEGLNAEGDTFTAHLDGGLNAFGLDGKVGAQVTVTKTAEGYSMELEGHGALGVAERLGLPGVSAGASAHGTGSAAVLYEFDEDEFSTDDVVHATETLVGGAVGATVGGPLGGALIGGSAIDDLGEFSDAYAGVKVGIGVSGEVAASIGQKLGLNAGGSLNADASVSALIRPDGATSLVFDQSVAVSGQLSSGALKLPGLPSGELEANGTLSLSTEVPLDLQLSELVADPLGELEAAATTAVEGATTTLSGSVSAEGEASGLIDEDTGVELAFSATTETRNLFDIAGSIFSGDLNESLGALARKTQLEASVRKYTTSDDEVPINAAIPGLGGISLSAGIDSESATSYAELSGTPAQFLRQILAGGLRV